MINKLIVIVILLLGSLQSAYSQSNNFFSDRRKCYSRDRRFYLEYFIMQTDSTFAHNTGELSERKASGRWNQVGDTLNLTYDQPDPTHFPDLRIYSRYLVTEGALLPLVADKKGRLKPMTRWGERLIKGTCVHPPASKL